MKVIEVRNVHEALLRGMDLLHVDGLHSESRNGQVYVAKTPVTTVYRKPKERVMFWEERDANPFFHFMEGLWMLAGRKDLRFIEQYNSRMSDYSDDGKNLHGAYGSRWRKLWKIDQIDQIINQLKTNPEDRRCVLQMWHPDQDLGRLSNDVPCNTCVYFSITNKNSLQMTVSNRSNDIIWGAYGANAVHMSMLQEYMAFSIGVKVGEYYQISNNYHAYWDVYEPLLEKFLEKDYLDFYAQKGFIDSNPYTIGNISPYPMINTDKTTWDIDLNNFIENILQDSLLLLHNGERNFYEDSFFREVAVPISNTWDLYRMEKREEAMTEIQKCVATDWHKACWEWLNRRGN